MDGSFDFGRLLRNHQKAHKSRPSQFGSVVGGIKRRLENNLQHRKSRRSTFFDTIRNLSVCVSPAPAPKAQTKEEHRRQQLEKWKEQKEKQKKELAAQKKKPFVAGVARVPLKFVLPPPLQKPSTSGRVTRSQSAKTTTRPKDANTSQILSKSFAPKNASFRPPNLQNLTSLPKLSPNRVNKGPKANITFDPVVPNILKEIKLRSKAVKPSPVESKRRQKEMVKSTKQSLLNPSPKKNKPTKSSLQTSSSSEIENNTKEVPVFTGRSTRYLKAKEQTLVKPGPKKNKPTKPTPLSSSSSEIENSTKEVPVFTGRTTRYLSTKEQTLVKPSIKKCKPTKSTRSSSSSEIEDSTKEVPIFTCRSTRYLKATERILVKPSPKKNKSTSSSEIEESTKESPILTGRSTRGSLPAPESPIIVIKTPRKSMPKEAKHVTPKSKIPKSESGSEEKLRSPKLIENAPMTPEQIAEEAKKISPCVTISRGKDNARKEMKKKLTEGLLDEDASDMDSVDHFRRQLASEIKRLTEMCDKWDKIFDQTVLPDDVQDQVRSAVGLTRLLLSQKLAQFASLVETCASPEPGQALVTPADLHGFWDMVYMQVENVDIRFKDLEEMRDRGWAEAVAPVELKKKIMRANVKKVSKPSAGNSRLKDMIAAARKAKKEHLEVPAMMTDADTDSKTFEAGFFRVKSPVRSPAAHSPATPGNKGSLLKAVLSNETKKSASKCATPFAMLRASVMGRNIDCEGVAPIPQTPMTPINLYATPGRSILKSTNTGKKSNRKSIKVVLFNHSDITSLENSFQTITDNDITELKRDEQIESRISLLDTENIDNKENSKRKSRLVRQDAEERSPVLTRSRRKSVNEEVVTPRRSSRKTVLTEAQENGDSVPRSNRRKRNQVQY